VADNPTDSIAGIKVLRHAEESLKRAEELERAELERIVDDYFSWATQQPRRKRP
jgi:hypothetical protein